MTVELMRSKGLDLDMPLDGGIAQYVHVLREAGVETYESCEGGDGHPFLEPTVRIWGGPHAGFKAYGVALEHGLPVKDIRRFWTVLDGELTGPNWEMTFSKKAQSAD